MKSSKEDPGKGSAALGARWELRLYVAGQTPKSVAAFANLKKLCEQHVPGQYHIEVIDLLKEPGLAKGDQIFRNPDSGTKTS